MLDTKLNYDINTILAYGVIFGILLMSIIYTTIRYIYSKEFFYISYCLMQVFSLVYIISYSQLFQIPYLIQEVALVFATIFAISFAISFLKGEFIPKIESQEQLIYFTILFVFVLVIVFYHYILFQYLPYSVIYLLLFLSVIFNIKKGFRTTLVYVFGWSFVCLFLYLMQIKNIYIETGYVDLVLIAFAIEAILFTSSVSSKYHEVEIQNIGYENMLFHQNRLAKTGAMISNIVHQWRQPLNNLSYMLINIKKRYDKGTLEEEYFLKKMTQSHNQIQFMSKTLDDFKDFYLPTKIKEDFLIYDAISKSLTILSADIKQKDIEISVDFYVDESIRFNGIENELSQVLLILFNNAIDALESNEKPKVMLEIYADENIIRIEVYDNGGGIKTRDLNKIFESYYTTKKDGFGIGLNLARTIIQKSFNGDIKVENVQDGAKFSILLNRSS